MELQPRFATYHRWGPGYFNWIYEDGKDHAFGWDLYKRKHNEENLALRIWFPETKSEPLRWGFYLRGIAIDEKESKRSAEGMLSSDGIIDQERIVRWLDNCVKRWKLV